jgi:hypothetical protein
MKWIYASVKIVVKQKAKVALGYFRFLFRFK